MKALLGLFSLMAFAIGNLAHAQSSQDEKAVRELPHAFSSAWAKHDGHELAKIMAEDVDFVTVSATWLSGRADFEKYHTRLLSGQFKEAIVTPLETAVRFIRPDLALVHWSWRVQDKNADGSARPPRSGLMTMLAAKQKGKWLVVAAQNTNSGSVSPDLLQDIKSPITVPRIEP